MKLLLDPHAFMWWDSDPTQLSAPALSALRDPANEVWLNVASVWEMVIKAQLGKLALRLPLADIVSAAGERTAPSAGDLRKFDDQKRRVLDSLLVCRFTGP